MTKDLRLFCKLSTGWTISFGQGKFDEWCIYFEKDGQTYFPKDSEYFTTLQTVGKVYNRMYLYSDFIEIYDKVGSETQANQNTIERIWQIALQYDGFQARIENVFGILYAGMIAEEQKANKILVKRIKRLGVHQVLVENINPEIAANFSRGMKWPELQKECQKRGF